MPLDTIAPGQSDRANSRIDDWTGKRVTVMGLGRFGGGVGVARWLSERGARVLVTDKEPAGALEDSLTQIRDCLVELRLGGHEERDFREADVVIANPVVPDSSPFLAVARAAGVQITTEINLFVQRCRGDCVGITGSVGKSTITAMTGHILERRVGGRRVWVGGNIGRSLLDALDEIAPRDIVVLELSSFQLHRTPFLEWSPRVAVLTGVTPNHLDWHGSLDAYRDAKLNIFRFQSTVAESCAILGQAAFDNSAVRAALLGRRDVWLGRISDAMPVVGRLAPSMERMERELPVTGLNLQVPGRHNLANAAMAIAIAQQFDVNSQDAAAALADFEALPHRLQRACVRDGVSYFNDSKSTTPEAAQTAIDAMTTPFCIILGGYDKGSDLTGIAQYAAARARYVACIGQTGPGIAATVRVAGGSADQYASLPDAVEACRVRLSGGEAILLSPACASWDMFTDYRERGDLFCRIARGAV
ncbi:MAG: UDP-N-acetylmuramoyl-L-alanine--D-glutamate ligase [Phycisphaerales bacterium]|nr:UDP-N-acetylmuramoyl-L-alanine--D-glutamate ligase [Phycisphaerales bacterium]